MIFFKSLAGIAVGAVVAPKVIIDAFDVSEAKEVLPVFDKEVTIQTGWVAVGESGPEVVMKPNSNPPMTQAEYDKHMNEKNAQIMDIIDRNAFNSLKEHLI